MEKQPHQEYRDGLAGKLKEIRNSDAEKGKQRAVEYLGKKKETNEYKEALQFHQKDIEGAEHMETKLIPDLDEVLEKISVEDKKHAIDYLYFWRFRDTPESKGCSIKRNTDLQQFQRSYEKIIDLIKEWQEYKDKQGINYSYREGYSHLPLMIYGEVESLIKSFGSDYLEYPDIDTKVSNIRNTLEMFPELISSISFDFKKNCLGEIEPEGRGLRFWDNACRQPYGLLVFPDRFKFVYGDLFEIPEITVDDFYNNILKFLEKNIARCEEYGWIEMDGHGDDYGSYLRTRERMLNIKPIYEMAKERGVIE